MVPAALWMDRPWNLAWSAESIASVVWLGLFATALATISYFRLIQRAEPTFLSLINYMIPVVTLAAGAIVLDEDLLGTVLVGMALILTGLAISQLGIRSGWARQDSPILSEARSAARRRGSFWLFRQEHCRVAKSGRDNR